MDTPEEKKRSLKKDTLIYVLLELLIAVELVYTGYTCLVKKQYLFSDEAWSYGLSNSYYQPFIHLRDGVRVERESIENQVNLDQWVDGSVFEEYITVQRGERFAYGSVFHNQSLDRHPPLYYVMLHTVCSFFPDSYSRMYAFVPNCVFLAVTQAFLFLLAEKVTKDKVKALMVCLLYGGGQGALCTFIYLRQYSLLTMLMVMHTYFAALIYYDRRLTAKRMVGASLTALFTFLTHYYGIAFIGVLTALMCLSFLWERKLKRLLVYGGSVLASLLAALAVYPAAIDQIINNEVSEKHVLDLSTQYRRIVSYITDYCFGYRISVFRNSKYAYVIFGLVCALAVAVPVIFLFRKSAAVVRLLELVKSLPKKCLTAEHFCIILLIDLLAVTVAVNFVVDPIDAGEFCVRHVFMLFPFACLTLFRLLSLAAGLLPHAKKIADPLLCLCVAGILIVNNVGFENVFLFRGIGDEETVREAIAGKNCLLLISGTEMEWHLTTFAPIFGKAAHVYAVPTIRAYDEVDNIMSSDHGIDCVVVKTYQYAASEEQLRYIREHVPEGSEDFDITENMDYEIPVDDDGKEDRFMIGNANMLVDKVTEGRTLMPQYVINANDGLYAVYFVQ